MSIIQIIVSLAHSHSQVRYVVLSWTYKSNGLLVVEYGSSEEDACSR